MSECYALLRPNAENLEKSMKQFTHSDWTVLNSERAKFYRNHKTEHSLGLFMLMEHDPVLGYPIDPHRYCLQAATTAYQDGFETQILVTVLFHAVGFKVATMTHGEFVAQLLRSRITEQNYWMLAHLGVFHPYYEWTKEFVDKFDQNAMGPLFPIDAN